MYSSKRLVLLSLLTTFALVIYCIELQIPVPIPIPGVKLGLANMISLITLMLEGPLAALAVLLVRIFLGNILTGQLPALLFSLSGGLLSLGGMILCTKCFKDSISIWSMSLLGGLLHNIGQILVAYFWIRNAAILYYLPFLMMSGLITGLFIGLGAQFTLKTLKKHSL